MKNREIIEALIFATAGALPVDEIVRILPDLTGAEIETLVQELNAEYARSGRSFRIDAAGGGYMFVTLEGYSHFLKGLREPVRLSNAAMEVLAVIAYKGPCTKQMVDSIRGVDSSSSLKSLLKAELIDVKAGKPLRYRTTPLFLEVFGLDALTELPDMQQFEEIYADEV